MDRGSRIYASLLAGAIGDALGRPVERLRTPMLYEYYGENGIEDLATVGMKARITDDTQMTLFTAEGLIETVKRYGRDGIPDMGLIYAAYQRWYITQTEEWQAAYAQRTDLLKHADLFSPVGPGKTCLEALKAGIAGSIAQPVNNSWGCGGVMRTAPMGFVYGDAETAFRVGAECAALTHGGPEAYLPSGFHSAVIALLMKGGSLDEAFDGASRILKTYPGYESTLSLIEKARALAKTHTDHRLAIESLGYGFTGHEALAIAAYCLFKNPDDLKAALLMAVNHSGDSDSTGAITGNILGAAIGLDTLPRDWMDRMELLDVMKAVAEEIDALQAEG